MMVNKKDVIIAILTTFCLTVTLLSVLPTRSQTNPYDPWLDTNDDGRITMDEIMAEVYAFGSKGDPINKTALLIYVNDTYSSLLSDINNCNSSLIDLSNRVAYLEATINNMNATFTQQVNALNASITSLMDRVSALEANYSVTNLDLAPYAIPFNSTFSNSPTATTETLGWVDMADMSVSISLNRTSHLVIMFSADAYDDNDNVANYTISIQAMINSSPIHPGPVELTPTMRTALGSLYTHVHTIYEMAYTYNFYQPAVPAGTYTIKIQWRVTGGTGIAGNRTLTVIALPA